MANTTLTREDYCALKRMEGFRAAAYRDSGGLFTIGYGTTRYPNGNPVKQGDRATLAQAEIWLEHDSKKFIAFAKKYLNGVDK